MSTVKKLRLILSETEQLMAELEQRHRNVLLRFTCYCNNQAVYQSSTLKRGQLMSVLPEACKKNNATELDLLITGTNTKLEPAELYKESFSLATKDHQNLPVLCQNSGLGGFSSYPNVPQMYGGLAGLGAPPEVVVMAQHMAADYQFKDQHRRLQEEADALRQKVRNQEQQIELLESRLDTRSGIMSIVTGIKAAAPIVGTLIGTETKLGQALNGVGSADLSGLESEDDALTSSAVEMVREFMVTLHPTHQNQLVWVMQNVQQDHNQITLLANFLAQKKKSGQSNPASQKPEQKQKQNPQHGQHRTQMPNHKPEQQRQQTQTNQV